MRSGWFVELFLFISAFLMASRLPTVSLKKFRIPVRFVIPVLMCAGLFAGALVYEPWLTVGVVSVLYLLSVPLCSYIFLRLKAKEEGVVSEKAEETKA